MTYLLLSHPNPVAVVNDDGRYWGHAEMSADPRCVTLHTTESLADVIGEDMGAENIANYFATTTTPSSYHTVVDSDTTVRLLPAGLDGTTPHTAFHCYQRNTANLGVAIAMRAATWGSLPPAWETAALERAATETALLCVRWSLPVVRIGQAEFDAGGRGISGHGLLQPEDRTDPGAQFPWARFLALVQAKVDGYGNQLLPGGTTGDDDMARLIRTPEGTVWSTDGVFATQLQPNGLAMLKAIGAVPATPEWGANVTLDQAGDLLVAAGDGRVLPLRTVLAMLNAGGK